MPRATWNGAVLSEAATGHTEQVEGNTYFPPEAVNKDYFHPSDKQTVCPWKGTASYYDVVVDGQVNKDAAWYYPAPKEAAANIKDHVAFWRGVAVEE